MPNNLLSEILREIDTVEVISATRSFEILQLCSDYFRSEKSEPLGRKLVINLLNDDNWKKMPETHHPVFVDILESAGFYPYIAKNHDFANLLTSLPQQLRKEAHDSEVLPKTYLHEEQKVISDLIKAG